ncbi:MAG: hypothetical protein ACI9VR_000048 [Cognaticolwellia sp.]|jgi:hypothetical protein
MVMRAQSKGSCGCSSGSGSCGCGGSNASDCGCGGKPPGGCGADCGCGSHQSGSRTETLQPAEESQVRKSAPRQGQKAVFRDVLPEQRFSPSIALRVPVPPECGVSWEPSETILWPKASKTELLTPQARSVLLIPGLAGLAMDGQNIGLALSQALKSRPEGQKCCVLYPLRSQRPTANRKRSVYDTLPKAKSAAAVGESIALEPSFEEQLGHGWAKAECDDLDVRSFFAIEYQYREVKFCVPASWFVEYIKDYLEMEGGRFQSSPGGMVSSVDYTLDFVWPNFQRDTGPLWSTVDSLIGCYNIPTSFDKGDYLFWWYGKGAPRVYLQQVMKLVYVGWSEVRDDYTGTDFCSGFGNYVANSLSGLRAENQPRRQESGKSRFACRFRWDIFGGSVDGMDDRARNDCVGIELSSGQNCKEGFKPDFPNCDSFKAWNDWTPIWEDGPSVWAGNVDPSGTKASGYRPEDGTCPGGYSPSTDASVKTKSWAVAFDACVADQILFWARMSLDYGRQTYSFSHLRGAEYIGRYALRMIAGSGRTLIHEMGHSFMGQGCHCPWNCCFEIAAQRWLCKTMGQNGLPMGEWAVEGVGDYPAVTSAEQLPLDAVRLVVDDACSSDASDPCACGAEKVGKLGDCKLDTASWASSGYGYIDYSCDLVEPGFFVSDPNFCSVGRCSSRGSEEALSCDRPSTGGEFGPSHTDPCVEACLEQASSGFAISLSEYQACLRACRLEGFEEEPLPGGGL